MANRRMFSKVITNSARFLKMPVDSQNLYFHLGMSADDDGVVEAYSIMKAVGSNEDNLRVLVTKGFIKILNDDLVSYITDWKEHNLIRPDRKVDSIYKKLLLQIVPEVEFMEPKPRADTGKITGRPVDDQWTADGPHRLGEDSIGQDRKGKGNNRRPTPAEIQTYIDELKEKRFTGQHVYDFYQTIGWVYGKDRKPIKDWKAAVRTWIRHENKSSEEKNKSHYRTL